MLTLRMIAAGLFWVALGVLAPAVSQTANAQTPQTSSTQRAGRPELTGETPYSSSDWQRVTRLDVAAFADAARQNYIYAAYPEPAVWQAGFDRTVAEIEAKVPLVHDAEGYQAIIRYLSVTFQDAHVGARFTMPPIRAQWPGFLVRFDDGRYRVIASQQSAVLDGTELTACDGKPVSEWIELVAGYEVGGQVGLETTRMSAALRLLVDRGSPLRQRPSRCVIGDRQVTLEWRDTSLEALQPVIASWQGNAQRGVNTRMIGDDGAWVTLGYFAPRSPEQAAAFHAEIAQAPSLREKRFVVLDVRGNGGGPYNWSMAYLRGLYGPAYADYYATDRLHIQAVLRLSPAYLALEDASVEEADAFDTPADPPYEVNKTADDEALARARAAGDAIFRTSPITIQRGPPPTNPVRGKVYVLTDYGCASACIAFVDELKRFPDVVQIGLPTFVDSRSGTAVAVGLPSGHATIYLPAMTRDGRPRGDNLPQVPSVRFTGDIRDDQAVEHWVLSTVMNEQTRAGGFSSVE